MNCKYFLTKPGEANLLKKSALKIMNTFLRFILRLVKNLGSNIESELTMKTTSDFIISKCEYVNKYIITFHDDNAIIYKGSLAECEKEIDLIQKSLDEKCKNEIEIYEPTLEQEQQMRDEQNLRLEREFEESNN